MSTSIRPFKKDDIPLKIKWINDENNNQFLHYDLPLEYNKTLNWYHSLKNRNDRLDLTITYNGNPVGIIGLLNIDLKNKKAEYYICLGEHEYKGKGIAEESSKLLINKSYQDIGLQRIYLYTETENKAAQRLFEKVGFEQEGLLRKDLIHNGDNVDRYIYGLITDEFYNK